MDPLTAIAASGLRARMESLDLLANNVANAATDGFKADREFYSLYVASEAQEDSPPSTMPVIEKPWVDYSQGLVRTTGNQLDLALTGKGFFAAQSAGGPLYTRNGSFHLAADGKLVTEEGYALRGANGLPVTAQSALPIDVLADGTIQQEGNAIGRLEIVDFPGGTGLTKQGNNYFQSADQTRVPAAAAGTVVEQGRLEASNTGSAESAVRLVSVMRQFEMLQKAVSLGGDMNRQAVEQVAKVGQ